MMTCIIFAEFLLLFITFAIDDPYIHVPGLGSLYGVISNQSDDVAVFMSIPYAKPPVGKLRWQPPQVHGPWTQNPLNATWFGPRCMQSAGLTPDTSGMSEDCLFLNVAAPISALNSSKKLPVMFWIHGGGYNQGESNDYPLDALVAQSKLSIITVTINYRLNIFGFLGSAEIQKHTPDGSAGNFGIQDQRLAMSWVRDHIGIFGGDGSDITIFGESAGGNSVINHLAQPASFPLYKKAIIESGAYSSGANSLKVAEKIYDATLKALNCKDLDCLLQTNAKTVLFKTLDVRGNTAPVIDGISLTAAPTDLIAQGKHNKVPVMIGSNRDESAFFDILERVPPKLTEAEFDTRHARPDLSKIKQLYDPAVYPFPKDLGNYSRWWWTGMRLETDSIWGLGPCAVRKLSRSLLKGGTPIVFAYLFAHPYQVAVPSIPGTGPGSVVVPHASEIAFVFGERDAVQPQEFDFAVAVSSYWHTFAKAGKPNPSHMPGLPEWPKYTAESDTILRLDMSIGGGPNIRTQQALRKAVCDYNDAHH